jgi:stress-induced-phosphoprotein 1
VYQFDRRGIVGEIQVLTDFQENPKAAQEHMKNPMVMGRIQKLVNAGIVQVR